MMKAHIIMWTASEILLYNLKPKEYERYINKYATELTIMGIYERGEHAYSYIYHYGIMLVFRGSTLGNRANYQKKQQIIITIKSKII